MRVDDSDEPIDRAAIQHEAYRLEKSAEHWGVEVPEEWKVTVEEGFDMVGGLYHQRLAARIRTRKLTYLGVAIGAIAAVASVASLVWTW